MKIEDIYICDCKTYIPKLLDIAEVENSSNEDYLKELDYQSIAIEDKLFPAEMACQAINKLNKKLFVDKGSFISLFYSFVHKHGHNAFWSPASFLQREYQLLEALPINLSQGCNSQMLAIYLSIIQLMQSDNQQAKALIASADAFGISDFFSRWHSNYGVICGDGANAVVLGKQQGFAKILNFNTVTDPDFEEMHRHERAQVETGTDDRSSYYDTRVTKLSFLAKYGTKFLNERTRAAFKRLHEKTFTDCKPEDISYFILPNLGRKLLVDTYYPVFPEAQKKSIYQYGRTIGHVGASDCMIGLAYILEKIKPISGEKILVVGSGAGFTWSSMLVEIV